MHKFARILGIRQPVFKRAESKRLAFVKYVPLVQFVGYFFLVRAVGVLSKDKAHNFGLFLVNGYFVYRAFVAFLVGIYEFIPVNEITAAIRSVFNARVQSVAYTLGKSFAVFLVVPFQKHFVYFAALVVADWLGCRNYPYAVLLFLLCFVHYTVNAVACKPIELVNDNILKRAFVRVAYHFLKVWAVVVRSRSCLVHIGLYDSKTLAFGICGANAYLPLNRLLVLSL